MRRTGRQEGGGIEAVFFDIGNVLVSFDARRLAARFVWTLRRRPLKAVELLFSGGWLDALERGDMTSWEFFRRLRDEAGFPDDFARFQRLWCGSFRLERAVVRIMERVARRRRVYLLSNTNRMHFDFIRKRYSFPRLAAGAVLSYRLGLRKPEPAMFRAALRIGGVRPDQAFFVDDVAENVEAAGRLGMRAWRHRGPEALERRLQELGVL